MVWNRPAKIVPMGFFMPLLPSINLLFVYVIVTRQPTSYIDSVCLYFIMNSDRFTISSLCEDFNMTPGRNLLKKGEINSSFLTSTMGLSRRESAAFMKTLKIYIKENVRLLKEAGASSRTIAQQLGVSKSTVNYCAKQVCFYSF